MIKEKQNQEINENSNYYKISNYRITLSMQKNQQRHLLMEIYAKNAQKENNKKD
jgi:hypothetical protein